MKALFIICSVLMLSPNMKTKPTAETYVYICDSRTAYAYHKTKDCVGLDNCKHDIIRVMIDDAKDYYKRKPCQKCERSVFDLKRLIGLVY